MILLLHFILGLVFTYLAFNALYLFLFAAAGRVRSLPEPPAEKKNYRFVVYIAAYKGDAVIRHTAPRALQQSYPEDRFDVVVIADSLQPETLTELRTHPLKVVEVSFEKSTKAKALKKALEATTDPYDYAVILDIDNIMEVDFLQKVNRALQGDVSILQAHRVALNLDTPFAILDGISEEVNNHIFRQGHRALGLSAAFIGSGKAISFDLYREVIPKLEAIGGFDKELELTLLSQRYCIHYAPDARVFDEKVQEAARFEKQRKRWLSAQFHYFNEHIGPGLAGLFRGNVDYFDKVIQMILFPRVLLLGTTFLLACFALLIPVFPGRMAWLILLGLTVFSIGISVPVRFYNGQTLRALAHLPSAFWRMFRTLFKLRGANQQFIHTEHTHQTPTHEDRH